MVKNTDARLRQERANLWRAKNLYRHFIGDESWIPCERVEATGDWDLFEPHGTQMGESPIKKRKLNGDMSNLVNGVDEQDHAQISNAQTQSTVKGDGSQDEGSNDVGAETNDTGKRGGRQKQASQHDTEAANHTDVSMTGVDDPAINGAEGEDSTEKRVDIKEEISNEADLDQANGKGEIIVTGSKQDGTAEQVDAEARSTTAAEDENDGQEGEDSPALPTRRITRALAAEASTSNAPPTPLSPASTASDDDGSTSQSASLLQPHPLFLLPPHLYTAHSTHPSSLLPLSTAHSGLPIDEILETRKFLGMYIQKQEECIRGLENILGKLIKAKRRRDKIWEWSKAEGHLGELSDGEDWIDAASWGLAEGELRKGRDEDDANGNGEEDVNATGATAGGVGRKGKRRRARE